MNLNISKINQLLREKSAIIGICLILFLIIYLFLFVIPSIKIFFQKFSECAQLKAKIVRIEKDWKDIDSLKTKIAQASEKSDRYNKRLPSKKEFASFLEYLSFAAKEMNVRITEIKPAEQDKGTSDTSLLYYQAPIFLKAECAYHQLGRFLSRLESAERFMKIRDIQISTNPNKANIQDIQLTVLTYVMKR